MKDRAYALTQMTIYAFRQIDRRIKKTLHIGAHINTSLRTNLPAGIAPYTILFINDTYHGMQKRLAPSSFHDFFNRIQNNLFLVIVHAESAHKKYKQYGKHSYA